MLKKIILLTLIYCSSTYTTMKLISPAFNNNQPIPTQYSYNGRNISPALAWYNAPENTASFALIVQDPDASPKAWTHWIVFNIPVTIEHITENQGGNGEEVPFLQGKNDFGTQKWGGPCPPHGTHHYHFTLYALDSMIDLPAGASKEELLNAMSDHVLEKTTLIGIYQQKTY